MKLKLHLIPHAHPQRATSAWFVPSTDPAMWLSIIAKAGLPLREVEVRVVPMSAEDRTPLGALLSKPGWVSRPTPLAQPYGQVAGCLFLPIHAKLLPPLNDNELADRLTTASAVFHPVAGLVGYEPGDVASALTYVEPRVPSESDWSMPESGPETVKRLSSLEPIELLSIDDVEEQLGGDIDKRPLDELPPTQDEKKPNPLGKAGQGAVSGIAGVVGWLTSQAPGTAAKRTWVDAVHDWAMSHKRQPGQADQEQRNQEINRLIEMLKESPDQGLSYAIPMSGLDAARGSGFSGNRLTPRSTGFSLSGLFGGGSADPWDIAHQQQQELIRSYRKLAVQEAQQGRYRRAAYIYASLLGDIEASARVLEEGGHYDEAAVILRDKLKRPIAAAECLERGGRLSEAIWLYLENNRWTEAARLYERLEQIDEAHQWYRYAAQQQVEARDFIGAAKLYEDKLADIDKAYEVLDTAWRTDLDPQCVPALFDLTGRHGLHQNARAFVGELSASSSSQAGAGQIVQQLADAHKSYPDAATRQVMAGEVMNLAGAFLPGRRSPSHARPFTEAIAALTPGDKLLARDARRYIHQLNQAMPVQKTPKRARQSVVSLGTRANAPTGSWYRMFATSQSVYLLGDIINRSGRLYVSAITGLERDQPTVSSSPINAGRWDPGAPFANQVVCDVFRSNKFYQHYLFTSIVGQPRIPIQSLLKNKAPLGVGHIDSLPDTILAMCGAMPSQIWALTGTLADSPELVLNSYSLNFELLESIPVLLSEKQIAELYNLSSPPVVCLHARKDYVVLSIGPLVMKFADGTMIDKWIETAPIIALRGAVPFGRARYALFFNEGVRMVWDQPGVGSADQRVLASVDHPVGAMTNTNGLLAIAHARGCHVYSSTQQGELRLIDELNWPAEMKSKPTDVVAIGNRDDFAVLFQDGTVQYCVVRPPKGSRY
jgi:tetratricopeptide (TPR) repeat protein